jgi:hypothetical protein
MYAAVRKQNAILNSILILYLNLFYVKADCHVVSDPGNGKEPDSISCIAPTPLAVSSPPLFCTDLLSTIHMPVALWNFREGLTNFLHIHFSGFLSAI